MLEEAELCDPGADLTKLASLPIRKSKPDSAPGYAVRFIQKLRLVRFAIERDQADDAARFGLELGALAMEAGMKVQHEENVLLGISHRESSREGGRIAGLLLAQIKAKRNREIRQKARELREAGYEIPDIKRRISGMYKLTTRQIGNILKLEEI